jgi:hypothetical protein
MAINISPGDTLTPAANVGETYSGVVSKSGGSFTDNYTIDFTNFTHPDEWSFRLHAVGLDYGTTHLTGLTSLTMSLYDASNALLWTAPAAAITTTKGLLKVSDLTAYSDAMYNPGNYKFVVSGTGKGNYDITLTVPEPETWAIFVAGLALLGLRLRNHQNALG